MSGFAQLATRNSNITSDCHNVTDGGEIEGPQENCGPFDPDPILSVVPGQGGTGELEYVWLWNDQPLPEVNGSNGWVEIPNTNVPSYDPGLLTETRYFTRFVRRSGCTQYIGQSNMINKTILNNYMAVFATESSVICNGQPALLTASSAEHYHWSTDQYSQSILVSDTGYYWVANQCDTSALYYVGEAELEPPVIEQTSLCSFGVVNFNDSLNYQWYLDGEPISGSTAQFNSDSLNGTYTVMARSTNGCNVESNSFSCYNNTTVGEIAQHTLSIYPNPTTNQLHVQFAGSQTTYRFTVFSIQGKVILSDELLPNNSIDVSSIPSGIHFIQFIDEHGTRVSAKFSKLE
jgi:hypothetical protein